MVFNITLTIPGPQMVIIDLFYSRYNRDWIAYTNIVLDPNRGRVLLIR